MHKNSACNNIKMWTAETRIEENKEIQTTTQTKTVNKVTQKPVQLKFCILPKFHHQVQGKNRKLNFAMHCHTIIGFNVKSTETSWHNLKKGKKRKKNKTNNVWRNLQRKKERNFNVYTGLIFLPVLILKTLIPDFMCPFSPLSPKMRWFQGLNFAEELSHSQASDTTSHVICSPHFLSANFFANYCSICVKVLLDLTKDGSMVNLLLLVSQQNELLHTR